MNNTPMGRSKSLKLVEAALLGKDHDVAGVLESFQSMSERIASLKARQKRVGGLYDALGAGKNLQGLSDFEREQYKVGANEFFLEGGTRFDFIRSKMKPEYQEKMDQVRQAAIDADSMFRALGFGPSRKNLTREDVTKQLRTTFKGEEIKRSTSRPTPTWGDSNLDQLMKREDRTNRADVTNHLHTIFKGFKKFGGKKEYDALVLKTFEEHPNVLAALKRMTEERAFGWLRRQWKGDEAVDIFGAKHAWHAAMTDFIQNHVDALVRHEGEKASALSNANPLNVPAPYAAGFAAPSEDDPNREAELTKISGAQAMEALFRAVELMQAKESQ
jgi:hypothetical protein